MHQNMSLGSNGVDLVHSLQKIPTRLRGTNFCTCSERSAPSLVRKPSGPKWYKTNQNKSLGFNGVDRARSSRKTPARLRGTNFCTSSARFALCFVRQPNDRICIQIVQNTPKYEFSVQWGGSGAFLRKIPMRLRGTNFCSSLARFALNFVTNPNCPKMLPNCMKRIETCG